jgi:hypothetical protein
LFSESSVDSEGDFLVDKSWSIRSISSFLKEQISPSEREKVLDRPGVGPAAFLIRDAVLGNVENPYESGYDPYSKSENKLRNTLSIVCDRLSAYDGMNRLLHASAWILALLSFIEPPYWCRNSTLAIVLEGAEENKFGTCGVLLSARGVAPDGSDFAYYPNSGSMWLTKEESAMVESVFLSVVTFFLLLKLGRAGFELKRFFRPGICRLNHGLQCISIFLIYGGLCFKYTDHHPFFRLILLGTFMRNFQREAKTLIKMVCFKPMRQQYTLSSRLTLDSFPLQ